MLQQLLVDAAEVLHRKVAVVDPAPPDPWLQLARHGIDDGHQLRVRQPHAGEDIAGMVAEQAAVIGRQAEAGIAGRHGLHQVGEV